MKTGDPNFFKENTLNDGCITMLNHRYQREEEKNDYQAAFIYIAYIDDYCPSFIELISFSDCFLMVWRYFWGLDEGAMIKNTEFRAQYATVESLVIKWDTEKTTDAEVVADMQHFKRPIIAKILHCWFIAATS